MGVHALGAHNTAHAWISQSIRSLTRQPLAHWQHLDPTAAARIVTTWAQQLDLDDVDALVPAPSHDGQHGPAHDTARIITAAAGIPNVAIVDRHRSQPSSFQQRSTTAEQLTTIRVAARTPMRVAVVDNTLTTAATLSATSRALTSAGYQVRHWLCLTDARPATLGKVA